MKMPTDNNNDRGQKPSNTYENSQQASVRKTSQPCSDNKRHNPRLRKKSAVLCSIQ